MKILFFAFLFLCLSCTKPMPVADTIKAQTLMYTQKQRLNIEGKNYLFVFSYLSPIFNQEDKSELFLLEITPAKTYIDDMNFSIEAENIKAVALDKNDELLKYIFFSEYANYFKLNFKEKFSKELKMNFCVKEQCFTLKFQKYSKSLFYRSVDVNTQYN